jgi:hypothetical protein
MPPAARPSHHAALHVQTPKPQANSTLLRRSGSLTARIEKELAELRSSRSCSEAMPPSAWVRREERYRQDLERYEATVAAQREAIRKLEAQMAALREAGGAAPLEQRIEVGRGGWMDCEGHRCCFVVRSVSDQQWYESATPPDHSNLLYSTASQELEQQLRNTASEKVQVQSKFHELSLKHRQLIETSPQIANAWREVLIQQRQDGGGRAAAALSRLAALDPLRQAGGGEAAELGTPALTGSFSSTASAPAPAPLPAPTSAGLPPVGTTALPPSVPPSTRIRRSPGAFRSYDGDSSAAHGAPQPQTPPASGEAAPAPMRSASGSSDGPMALLSEGGRALAGVEERAAALVANAQLEELAPEAKMLALQQLNCDLTLQLELYQRMVARLKDWMEHVSGAASCACADAGGLVLWRV